MEAIIALGLLVGLSWVAFWILRKIWPFLRFSLIFGAAFVVFGVWFLMKEFSPLGTLLGVVAVFVGAYRYAKNKVG